MRLQTLALAALATTLALPATAAEGRERAPVTTHQVELMRSQVLLEAELARPRIGDLAADLLQERARFARRVDQLELVIDDGLLAGELAQEGVDASELLLRSPSAVLVRDDDERTEGVGRPRWTRGSWMDSPDGAS